MNRSSVNDDKDDDEDKAKKKICSIAPLNVVDIHEMIMDKTNNEEELRKIELKLELKELSIDLIDSESRTYSLEFGANCVFGLIFKLEELEIIYLKDILRKWMTMNRLNGREYFFQYSLYAWFLVEYVSQLLLYNQVSLLKLVL